eukprot:4857004-Amphidinium_carterae.1
MTEPSSCCEHRSHILENKRNSSGQSLNGADTPEMLLPISLFEILLRQFAQKQDKKALPRTPAIKIERDVRLKLLHGLLCRLLHSQGWRTDCQELDASMRLRRPHENLRRSCTEI